MPFPTARVRLPTIKLDVIVAPPPFSDRGAAPRRLLPQVWVGAAVPHPTNPRRMVRRSGIRVAHLGRLVGEPLVRGGGRGGTVGIITGIPAAEDAAQDGEEDEDEVDGIPTALDGRRSEATKRGREEGRQEEKNEDGEQH